MRSSRTKRLEQLPAVLDPRYDVVFRRLFDSEDNCRLLKALLNALLKPLPGHELADLTLVPTHLPARFAKEREAIIDVHATDERGRQFHIEMQFAWFAAYLQRAVYYLTRCYSEQLKRSMSFSRLRPVVSLHFVNFTLLPHTHPERFHSVYELRERTHRDLFCADLELHIVELTRFTRTLEEMVDEEEKWVYFLKHGHEVTAEQLELLGVPEICEAREKLQMISRDFKLRMKYLDRDMAYFDRISWAPDLIEHGRQLGREEGREEGRTEGLKEGLRQGVVRGLLTLYEQRLGAPPPAVKERLEREADITRLQSWFELFASGSAAEILRTLELPAQ